MSTLEDDLNKPSVHMDTRGIPYYRMSALGSCSKALVAMRQGYDATRPPAGMQRRFDDGHLHEPDILRRLVTEFGFQEPWGVQDELVIPVGKVAIIVGHIDCRSQHPELTYGMPAVVDAKTASQSGWDTWKRIGDGPSLKAIFPNYWWQMGGYLAAPDHDGWGYGAFAVKNKNTGEMMVKVMGRDQFPTFTDIVTRVLDIEALAKGELPGTCDRSMFPCPVWYLHEEASDGAATPGLLDDGVRVARIESLAGTYRKARLAKVAAEKLESETKAELMKVLGAGKVTVEAGGFRVAKYQGTSTSFDKAQLLADHPEIDAAAYTRKTTFDAIRLTERETSGAAPRE